jgi:hypothetical protein
MFYIDDYNSKAVTNTPPKKMDAKIELAETKLEMDSKQLATFWYLAGVVIAYNFEEVQVLLSKYGYNVSSEQDATVAISEMLGTAKWPKFVKEFGEIMEETIDDKAMEDLKEMNDESGWVQALIAAIGAIGSSSLSLAASSKQQKAAKENAKAQMFSGVSAALAEKQKLEAEKEKTRREGKRATVWIVVTIIIVFAAIIGIVIYKRRKAKGTGE